MQAAFILAWGTKENILIHVLFELFLYSEYVHCHLASVIFRLVFIMHLLHLLFSAWNLFLLLHLVKATNCTNNYYTFFSKYYDTTDNTLLWYYNLNFIHWRRYLVNPQRLQGTFWRLFTLLFSNILNSVPRWFVFECLGYKPKISGWKTTGTSKDFTENINFSAATVRQGALFADDITFVSAQIKKF